MDFSKQQQQVIDAPIGNLLVSAAAGSGKTAVLVERIMKMITDSKNPIDIDRILIVTFTKNAAGELKTRIAKAIEKRLEENPDDENLLRQSRNLNFAVISTIDSFCQMTVKRYFHRIDIDPSFRILDKSEQDMLEEDALNEILEEAYGSEDETEREAMVYLADRYGDRIQNSQYTDNSIGKMITDIYKYAVSEPFPNQWLDRMIRIMEQEGTEPDLFLDEQQMLITESCRSALNCATYMARETAELGLVKLSSTASKDVEMLEEILRRSDRYQTLVSPNPIEFSRLTADKATNEDEKSRIEYWKNYRNRYKGFLSKDALADMSEIAREERKECLPVLKSLILLVRRFMDRVSQKEQELNAYDFSHVAHFALNILRNDDNTITEAAVQMSQNYDEIMIDEYQDSNYIQESVLTAIAKVQNGKPNLFMVGDVKQSIYKFRKACPEMFLDKYSAFGENPEIGTKIDLQRNYRSREQVLDSVNEIFRCVMKKAVGGVEYDSAAELYYSDLYLPDEAEEDANGKSECGHANAGDIECNSDGDFRSDGEQTETGDFDAYSGECLLPNSETGNEDDEIHIIINRIKELTNPVTGLVINRKREPKDSNDVPRIARYGDIAILTRKNKAFAAKLLTELRNAGIPVVSGSMKEYFHSVEVNAVISMLRILDNPFQEIELATILMCPVIGFTPDDMAKLAVLCRKKRQQRRLPYTFTIMSRIADDRDGAFVPVDDGLAEKCRKFMTLYRSLKKHMTYLTIHELIQEFFQSTGYYEYYCAMEDCSIRKKNLRLLLKKAKSFQTSSDMNLQGFISYIDMIVKNEEEIEDELGEEDDNAVKMMTVHKSKGLEFPIVFLADAGSTNQKQDAKYDLTVHEKMGIGLMLADPELHKKNYTFLRRMIDNRVTTESFGEDLRVLYVAMTRAREKLIVTAHTGHKTVLPAIGRRPETTEYGMTYSSLMKCDSFLSLILSATLGTLNCIESEELKEQLQQAFGTTDTETQIGSWKFCFYNVTGILQEKGATKKDIPAYRLNDSEYERFREELLRYHRFTYGSANKKSVPVKVSVSELKKQAYLEKEASEEQAESSVAVAHVFRTDNEMTEIPVPAFARKTESRKRTGAEFGTLCHRVLQLHDYSLEETEEECIKEWERMAAKNQIDISDIPYLKTDKLVAFFRSPIGQRMKLAAQNGTLNRERAFVMSVSAKNLGEEYSDTDSVLVQGIIDAWFEEEDGIVLLDYKTDTVPAENGEAELLKRYERQLQLYAYAIENGTGKIVKEVLIYSFSLNKQISIGYNRQEITM